MSPGVNRRTVLLMILGVATLTLAVSGSAAAVESSEDGIGAEVAGEELDTEDLESALEELNETTAALEAGNASLEDGEEAIKTVEAEYENMTEAKHTASTNLVENGTGGGSAGVFEALTDLDAKYESESDKTRNAVEAYSATIEHEQSDARSTVRLFVGGPLVGGLIVGLAAGTAVPLLAARRVEQKMKLSRNVDYDRKSVLVPMAVGLLLAIVGVAVLALLGGTELLEVIR